MSKLTSRSRLAIIVAALATVIAVLFQNCGNVSLNKLDSNSLASSCLDNDRDLTVLATNNTSSSSIAADRTEFRVYETRKLDGLLVPFVPQDSNTEWPPRWLKNNNPPSGTDFLSEDGKVFSTVMEENCTNNKITAKFNICGEEYTAERNFFVGSCPPTECNEHGIVTPVGQERLFYRANAATCAEDCESIRRLCQSDGHYGPPIDSAADPKDFTKSSCSSLTTSCTVAPIDTTTYCNSIPNLLIGGFTKSWNNSIDVGQQNIGSALTDDPTASINWIPYFTIPFQINNTFQLRDFSWVPRYSGQNAPDFLAISISPCRGDFRSQPTGVNDPYFNMKCRNLFVQQEGDGISYKNKSFTSAFPACDLIPGVQYFFNIQFRVFDSNVPFGFRSGCPEETSCDIKANF